MEIITLKQPSFFQKKTTNTAINKHVPMNSEHNPRVYASYYAVDDQVLDKKYAEKCLSRIHGDDHWRRKHI